ncbi:heme ABC transporter ATP-binding protein [Pandoraea cepalis]|uniref:Heme ABC transporter ATP-binding protein n=1 Tax=Pandoraea cepalis TaxID=2508294 RepID=A0AAW7MTU3_9BURK|nr:heme ABC transporter ATP-binding protein [Pandoraea cepalis]MDN4576292.1 heme ABC transporter ATP-binding protein [Pandoraea cepalis]MDN4578778.1 heme ABC transporter ATP-binding protein [Pandoraea cepalis]
MLSAHDLTIAHTDSPVLDGLSLDIRPGELLVLLGRNGAGKSTLLKAMAGDPLPARTHMRGDITLNGAPLAQYAPAALARLRAVLPQTAQLAFPFSALDIVAMGRLPYPKSHRRDASGKTVASDTEIATLALERAGALPLRQRDVTTLSGGEWARVQFARVLAQLWPDDEASAPSVPRYLLLDEPTAALDLAHQHHLLSLTRELAATWGVGAMAIVHDVNLAARHADRMALLANGRILATGTPREVMRADLIEATLGLPVHVMTPETLPGYPRLEDASAGVPFALPA